MPVTKVPGSVTENLKRIKGPDKQINTIEEAKALLEYMPKADIRCDEDHIRLYMAYQEAQNKLNGRDENLGELLVKAYHKVVKKGEDLIANVSRRVNSWSKALASL